MKLFWKIYLAVLVCFTAVVALISYITSVKQISDIRNHMVAEHTALGCFISKDIERGWAVGEWPFENLMKLSEFEGFLFWWIVRKDGTIHLADKTEFIGSRAYDYFPQLVLINVDGNVVLNRKKDCGVFIKSFGTSGNKWSFWYGFSTRKTSEMTRKTILSVFALSSLALVALGVVLYFLIMHYTKPVKNLAEGAFIIGKGDLSHRVQVQSKDELGYLAGAFNKMAEDLRGTTTSIDNLHREISERKKAEQEMLHISQARAVLNKLLSLSLRNLTLEEILEQAIDCITSTSWLGFESKGAIFLVEDEPEVLVMKAQRGLLTPSQTTCARVPFGQCICGRTALSRKVEFVDCMDERHENRYGGISNHGHYCVPILFAGKVLGVINMYVKAGLPYSEKDEDFLCAVAAVVAGIINRKRVEQRQAELLEEVESANQELKDFARIVSHDLKAPLRGIKTIVDWITTDYADKLDEDGKEQMRLLTSRVERMQNLIEGVLEYSRVGRLREQHVQVDLNELVVAIIDSVAPPENIQITIENELPVIECERTRITQVFQNLLSNAIKYMDKPQGQIRIGCVEESGFWKFSVADNGPGIEEKYFEKIFQIFQTLSPRDEFESTGVGLTVVKKIVEMYGGKIWVESKVGEGSTFFFTLSKQKVRVKHEKLEANIVS